MILTIITIIYVVIIVVDFLPIIKEKNKKETYLYGTILSLSYVLILLYNFDLNIFYPYHSLFEYISRYFS